MINVLLINSIIYRKNQMNNKNFMHREGIYLQKLVSIPTHATWGMKHIYPISLQTNMYWVYKIKIKEESIQVQGLH